MPGNLLNKSVLHFQWAKHGCCGGGAGVGRGAEDDGDGVIRALVTLGLGVEEEAGLRVVNTLHRHTHHCGGDRGDK